MPNNIQSEQSIPYSQMPAATLRTDRPIASPPVYISDVLQSENGIVVYDQGRIVYLLNAAQQNLSVPTPPPAHPFNPADETSCNSSNLKSGICGATTGTGIGIVANLACGLPGLAIAGFAGLFGIFCACYNPPISCDLEDCAELLPRPGPL